MSWRPRLYARCGECGHIHAVSGPVNGNPRPDVGERFKSQYCCETCLGEHGPTVHIRASTSEARQMRESQQTITMSDNPARCPICEEITDTEPIEHQFETGHVDRVFVCNACYADWTVRYRDPEVVDVTEER